MSPGVEVCFYDAHCHLQDERLKEWIERKGGEVARAGIRRMVVNGTSPEDWWRVRELADRSDFVKPSFGLHPWFVNTRPDSWRDQLLDFLESPDSAVGEIGLDRWIENYDIEAQMDAFLYQYRLAQELDRPISIHCLRAWGLLRDLLKQEGCSERGFLLHSYGGPIEMVEGFVAMGARFSFSGYFAQESKEKKRKAFEAVPLDRLLIETDAPDMLGPDRVIADVLEDSDGRRISSPLNLPLIYEYAAEMRGMELDAFTSVIRENFEGFFR